MNGVQMTGSNTPLERNGFSSLNIDDVPSIVVVDLDQTLVKTDTLWESILLLLKKNPILFIPCVFSFLRSRAQGKTFVASHVQIDPASLPYRTELLNWLQMLRSQKDAKGQSRFKLVLATGAHISIAKLIAEHLQIFDHVLATDQSINLTASRKAKRLVETFGEKSFCYIGDSTDDLHVWPHGQSAIVISNSSRLIAKTKRMVTTLASVQTEQNTFKKCLATLRAHQWLKNILLLVPALAAHRLGELGMIAELAVAFLAMSLCASFVYVMNDLFDVGADRVHPKKCLRPFASGDVAIPVGLGILPLLLFGGMGLAVLHSEELTLLVLTYLVLNFAYTFRLKKVVLVDVLLLTSFYTLRIYMGSYATSIPVSNWLLGFSTFFFLSLALAKRFADLLMTSNLSKKISGRGYQTEDLELLGQMGIASGFLSTVVFALYLNSPEVQVLYRQQNVLWFLSPVLIYWISHVWLLTRRGEMRKDPVVFAVKDPVSYVVGIVFLLIMLAAR